MNVKKFNLSTPTPCKEQSTDEILRTTSTIEIGCAAKPEKHSGKKRSCRKLMLFCAVCCIFSAVLFALPLSEAAKNFFSQIAQLVKSDEPHDTYYIKNSSVQTELPHLQPLLFPAASDSDILSNDTQDTLSASFSSLSVISNETSYDVDIGELLKSDFPINNSYNDDFISVFAQESAPQVLIIHTHGTESYNDCANSNYRSIDKTKNVVAQGKLLAEHLENSGIKTIHCEEMFDENSYIKAYSNSRSAVSEYLLQYPSIKYVIDLHRDAIPSADGTGYAHLCTTIDEKSHAQLMLVVGTDEAGADHPSWRKNLRTAFEVQKAVCEQYPTLMRSVNLRRASFNQQLSVGYFILEAGNCANDFDETARSIKLFAQCFAKVVND